MYEIFEYFFLDSNLPIMSFVSQIIIGFLAITNAFISDWAPQSPSSSYLCSFFTLFIHQSINSFPGKIARNSTIGLNEKTPLVSLWSSTIRKGGILAMDMTKIWKSSRLRILSLFESCVSCRISLMDKTTSPGFFLFPNPVSERMNH